jgi:hypothetical protein
MAGYCAAHSIWSVCDGETLIPLVGYLGVDDRCSMERLAMGPLAALVQGERKLLSLDASQLGAVLIKNGRQPSRLAAANQDCLILDVRFAHAPQCRLQYVLPYRSGHHELGFAVHNPVLSDCQGFDAEQVEILSEFFFKGLAAHEQGSAIWHSHYQSQLDQQYDQAGQFTLEELQLLRRAPLLVYLLVLGAEAALVDAQVQRLSALLAAAGSYRNPLLTRLVGSLAHDLPTQIAAMVVAPTEASAELRVIHQVFEAHLPEAESQAFAQALLALAEDLAASINPAQQAAVRRLRVSLGVGELCV